LLGLLALIPAVRLLKRLVPPRLFAGVYGLAAFSVIDRFRSLLYASPRVEWLVFLVEMVAALLLTLLIFSPERIGDIGWSPDDWKRRFMLAARKLLIALFAVAIVATCLGYARLGSLLGDGILGSAYVAIVIYAGAETFTGSSASASACRTSPRTSSAG
jgi:small-conductance mechanosensitive channel